MTPRPSRSPLFPNPALFRSEKSSSFLWWPALQPPPALRAGWVPGPWAPRSSPGGAGEEGGAGGEEELGVGGAGVPVHTDRKSTRLNSSHANISYAVFCLKKK